MIVSDDETEIKTVYNGPTDSVSVVYGNGFNKCGDFEYAMTDKDGVGLSLDMFTLETTYVDGEADILSFNL